MRAQALAASAAALFALVSAAASPAAAQELEEIRWISENYPPMNYQDEQGKPVGMLVEILEGVWDRAGLPEGRREIHFWPWPRAYRELENSADVCLFGMGITEERKGLFNFVGGVEGGSHGVIAARARGLKVASHLDLAGLTVGVLSKDIGERLLLDLPPPRPEVQTVSEVESLILMLDRGRLDAISYSWPAARWWMDRLSLNPDNLELVLPLRFGKSGYAFNKRTNPRVLERLQAALDEMRAEGELDRIRTKYF